MSKNSTAAYADAPRSGSGPGVLVLHSWWGLTEGIKDLVNRLADEGYTALAPDLFAGARPSSDEEGQQLLRDVDPNQLALGVQSCADALRGMPATDDTPLVVIGFSMGASLGLWYSERFAAEVRAVVGFYGTQGIDFTRTRSDYLLHMVADDPLVDDDELALMEASLGLAGRSAEIHVYESVGHHFAEPGTPGFDAAAAELAWDRTIRFLRTLP